MEPKPKIYLSWLIFGSLSLGLIILLISPLFQEIQKNSKSLVLTRSSLDLLERKIENLESFQIFYKKNKANFEKLDSLFINPQEPVDFIQFLEQQAQDSEVLLKISPPAVQKLKKGLWPSMNFRLTLKGPFPNFLKFLEKLESSPYLIEISSLNARRLTERDIVEPEELSVGDVEVFLTIKVYTK